MSTKYHSQVLKEESAKLLHKTPTGSNDRFLSREALTTLKEN
jgi:hypothetical protein